MKKRIVYRLKTNVDFSVSVSGIAPCSITDIFLPLHKKEMEETTSPIAAERYRSTLEKYKKRLRKDPSVRLRAFCNEFHVDYHNMVRWIGRQGTSVKELQQTARSGVSIKEGDTAVGFVPVVPVPPQATQDIVPHEVLSGISLTFTDDTIVTIKKGTPSAVLSLLMQYRKEASRCSD